jgi:signal transduction histidine kinase
VKHAQADTIRIHVGAESGLTKLRIIDDGVGIGHAPPTRDGLGLRIMHYRAASVGALLSIEPGADRGTVVTCTLRKSPLAAPDTD